MGEQEIRQEFDAAELRGFTKRLLVDLQALETLLSEGRIESGVCRIGAEQELFLVDDGGRPVPRALEVLAQIDDPRVTTELAAFNLEFNLDPIPRGSGCLATLEKDLNEVLEKVRKAARAVGAEVVLTGILPSLSKSDLTLDNMTQVPRYFALNEAMNRARGDHYSLRIKGSDELIVTHDNILLEACNTSFQLHLQVDPDDFAARYNVAQAIAAPVLAAATNSPLLFGRSLWRETRIALFQQSVDTRSATGAVREQSPRVSFGQQWVDESVLEIFREDIARFRVLLATEKSEDPFAILAAGGAPELHALRLHNGTVYRWNRPCYGITDGRPHLRIENRVLPAGPTVIDEVANAAFWLGLMTGFSEEYGDIRKVMDFGIARENFLAAARRGLGAQFHWPGRSTVPAQELILTHLIDLARAGLLEMQVERSEADRYLGVIEERVESGRTGSQWLIDSLKTMAGQGTRSERLSALVTGTVRRQTDSGSPVARWEPARIEEAGAWRSNYRTVEQLMTTELFTVGRDELVDLVANLMHWKHIRHVPVEDSKHRLIGLVTHRSILRLVARSLTLENRQPTPVAEIMERKVITVTPRTSSIEAIRLMRQHGISCLPVVTDDDTLVGIITERDFMGIAGQLLERYLGSDDAQENDS